MASDPTGTGAGLAMVHTGRTTSTSKPKPRPAHGGADGTRPSKRAKRAQAAGVDAEPAREREAQDKQNRSRPLLSCGECRRLKLKCDRVFPCQSCVKRGCAGICPDGALTSGKGSRYILANTEQLHDKISKMGERIRQLENALEVLQAKSSSSPHPCLAQDLLLIKNSIDMYGSDQLQTPDNDPVEDAEGHADGEGDETIGSPPSHMSDKESFFGQTARTEYLLSDDMKDDATTAAELPADIGELSRSFPIPWSTKSKPNIAFRQRIHDFLPLRAEAEYLCDQASQNALWQYTLDPHDAFIQKLLHDVYARPLAALSPHRLALLLMFLAVGCLVDLKRPAQSAEADRYHQLSRAALCEVPVAEQTDISAVQTLFMMTWYLLTFTEGKKAVSYAWGIMGLNAKLAHSVGLHRDSMKWKIMPDKVQERRALFWELMNIDARLSLSLGRPPSFSLQHTDCQRPSYKPDGFNSPVNIEAHYHEWKHAFLTDCLSPVLEIAVSAKSPEYSAILHLDCVIRDFPVPPILRTNETMGGSPSRALAMQQAIVCCGRAIALLQLHRGFYTQVLSAPGGFTISHKFAPSVLATYHSSCDLISCLETLCTQEPALGSRFSIFWSNAFSGAVALCLLVSTSPSSTLVPFALQELTRVKDTFEAAAEKCPKASKSISVLQDMISKSRAVFFQWKSGAMAPDTPATGSGTDNERLTTLAQRTRRVSTYSSTDTGHPASFNPWEHTHPSLLSLWEELSAQTTPSVSSTGSSADQMRMDRAWPGASAHLSPSESDAWLPGGDFGTLLAGIELDPVYGPISGGQPGNPYYTTPTFNFNLCTYAQDDQGENWMGWF